MGRTDLDGGAGGSGGSGGARVPFILHVYTDGIPVPRKRQHTACRQRDHRRQWNPIWCSTATQVAVRLRTPTPSSASAPTQRRSVLTREFCRLIRAYVRTSACVHVCADICAYLMYQFMHASSQLRRTAQSLHMHNDGEHRRVERSFLFLLRVFDENKLCELEHISCSFGGAVARRPARLRAGVNRRCLCSLLSRALILLSERTKRTGHIARSVATALLPWHAYCICIGYCRRTRY